MTESFISAWMAMLMPKRFYPTPRKKACQCLKGWFFYETVFQNLITNALKYNESDSPTINISSSARGNQTYQITVSDNGIGFDPKHADKIFEIFQRFHNIDEHEGTGIGLSICRRIIESHNGSIQVDSIVGEGSVFKIVLPTLTDAKNDK